MDEQIMPPTLIPSGAPLCFTDATIPLPLTREHSLAAGRWGVLNVLEGKLKFVDLASGETHVVTAPGHITIPPQATHRVELDGAVSCRIDFYREEAVNE